MKANLLKKLLYVPNYLSLQVAGVEICNKSVKYIEFFNKKGLFSIKNFGEISLLPGIVKEGNILKKDDLVKALTEVKNNIVSDFVRVSVAEEESYIFDVILPKEAKTNIREALEFKIEENVPLKLEEASFEYEIVEEKKDSKEMIVNVSVIPKKLINEYTELLNQVGMHPISFEVESKMVADSVIARDDRKNSILVNIKDDSTILIGVIDGFVRVSSSISIGESVIRENLLKTGLFSDKMVIDKFFETDFSFETSYTKDLYSSLINIFSILKDEVEKFDEYVINKFSEIKSSPTKNVDKIILCGRGSTLPGLAKHINQNISTEVVLANVWSGVFDVKENTSNVKFHDSLSFVTPIGLVVSSYKQTNV